MATLIYAPRAYRDLERFGDFLEDQSRSVIQVTFDRIAEVIELLEHHPLIGRQVEHGLRELVISHGKTGYVALYDYDPAEDLIVILAIRHRRDAGYRKPDK